MRDDKVLGSTVRIDLTTHDSTGALVAPSSAFAASDFRIYKDGSAAEKTSTNGITVTSPFDSIVGKHLVEIDTSNSTGDSGFWAAGSEYRVELNSAKTISSIVQSGVVVGRFALVAAGVLRPTVDGRTIAVSATTGKVTAEAVVLDSASINAVADQVWDEATSGHTTAGTYGGRIVRATNSNTEVQITGSNHIAADVHEFQSGVISAGDFAADSITASALATDAVTEIQSGLATSAALATESGKITNIENASGYLLAVLAGACADPQTASETYAITVFGSTFTVDMAGQTSTGTRTAPTLTKT